VDAEKALERVAVVVRTCFDATSTNDLLVGILPVVRDLAGCDAAALVREAAGGWVVLAQAGAALTWDGEARAATPGRTVPAPWRAGGIVRVEAHPLPADAGTLVLAWAQGAPTNGQSARSGPLVTTLAVLDLALARLTAEERLADLTARVDSAQQLANMGDYDWHIASDTNRWSDQLYRIYGHEPGSFNPSYERFLDHIHPDDRDMITAIHRRAHATGEPYEMVERIIRPDGQVRFLASHGQVICDNTGTAVRMRGTCIDITEGVHAERAAQRSAHHFRVLMESCPDGVLVLDPAGRIVATNARAGELLGADPVGHSVEEISPQFARGGDNLRAVGFDGRELQLDLSIAALHIDEQGHDDDEGLLAAFIHDAGPRLNGEAVMAALLEAQLRRRQALEINDNIVQGLTSAVLCTQVGDSRGATAYLERTLDASRRMMDDWLSPLDGKDLQPGDLVRAGPSTLGGEQKRATVAERSDREPARPRILVVDDNSDIRELIGQQLTLAGKYDVVGQAGDGAEAVDAAATLQPDVVLLDLSMPRMDGLQALPLVLAAVAGVRVVVMSGFAEAGMAERALAAGAVRYVEKGLRMNLLEVIDAVLSSGAEAGCSV
jgi:PAS domain S-box-containing protein